MMRDRPRVLLLWPGGLFSAGANFGVPQLLSMASQIRLAGADVDVVDLDHEQAFGPVSLEAIARGECGSGAPYDMIGLSCYSSFDYLKVVALAERFRALLPKAWIVAGGYHASARPDDFTSHEVGKPSPFDFVVVGDGELPMARLAGALSSGRRPLNNVLGPDSTPDPNEIPPTDWTLLSRYRKSARKVASQAEIYLSRGCPYDCAFCMERAKRDVSWRSLEPERAVEEMHRLDAFIDLRGWTLFVADALFGMKRSWRRTFLEGLARRPIRAKKIWLLIRLDLLEREDFVLMQKANVAPGFGLESGDPEHLKRIRKAGRLDDYLDQMLRVADWAHELHVPFGANVIVGHPGETEKSLRTSAKYLEKLFLADARGTMGFLSVDPFRLYPGSPIDEERPVWERDTGMKVHRYPWWHDGDQDFLSEWVDPSGSLDFRTALKLRFELFTPIVHGIAKRFAYQGPSRPYFMRSVQEQLDLLEPSRMLRSLGMLHLWRSLVTNPPPDLSGVPATSGFFTASDPELADAARETRKQNLNEEHLPNVGKISSRLRDAIYAVPRERFVRLEDIAVSAHDRALALDDEGRATISAVHAYVASFGALELTEGDELVELGGGTGYGAALAQHVVGSTGQVTSIEIDPTLCEAADTALRLAGAAAVAFRCGDAHNTELWRGAKKVSVAFAMASLPSAFAEALVEGGWIVAPVGPPQGQTLTLYQKVDGVLVAKPMLRVRYVPDRHQPKNYSEAEHAPD